MSESAAQLAALALTAIIMIVVARVMLRRRKRPGIIAVQQTKSRQILIGVLLSVAVVVGTWGGNRGHLSDPFEIGMAVVIWIFVMFLAFRRPRRS